MKILYVTTIGATMEFFKNFIEMLIMEGHTVDIATNDSVRKVPDCYGAFGCRVFTLSCSRSLLRKGNLDSIKQIKKLVEAEKYDIVHCHTPIAAVCTRLACRKLRKTHGVKVFYTAHGFHFFKGSSKLSWAIYYPVEKLCSRFTDKLITINREDHILAKSKFKAKEVFYVPGVGIDLSKFLEIAVDKVEKRREIGVPEGAKLILSVGELNENKNHRLVIRALSQMSDSRVHYVIAGDGALSETLRALAEKLGVADHVHLLGYRKDVATLYRIADVFCHPSLREGLPVSLMEAMACGLPAACSRIRGNSDLIDAEGGALFNPRDVEDCRRALETVLGGNLGCMGDINRQNAQQYSIRYILAQMKSIYES